MAYKLTSRKFMNETFRLNNNIKFDKLITGEESLIFNQTNLNQFKTNQCS